MATSSLFLNFWRTLKHKLAQLMNAISNIYFSSSFDSNIEFHTWQSLLRWKINEKKPVGWHPLTQHKGRSHSFPATSHKSQRSVTINKEPLVEYQAAGLSGYSCSFSPCPSGRGTGSTVEIKWQVGQTFSDHPVCLTDFYVNKISVAVNDDQTTSG